MAFDCLREIAGIPHRGAEHFQRHPKRSTRPSSREPPTRRLKPGSVADSLRTGRRRRIECQTRGARAARICKFQIENHSRLADASVEVREHLVLVGANDVGKRSLLRCLQFALGNSTAQLYAQVTANDFRDELAAFPMRSISTPRRPSHPGHSPQRVG